MAHSTKTYAFFDHTADIGIKAQAKTLAELFIAIAQGLVELIAEDSRLPPLEERRLTLSEPEPALLLWRWLDELLVWFSTDRFLPVEFQMDEVTPTSLKGAVRGGRFDPARHVQGREVKAITRHLLMVEQHHGMWHGEVIVDI